LGENVVLVPVNWRLAPPEAAAIMVDAEVEVLFSGQGYAPMVEAVAAEGYVARTYISMDGTCPDWLNFVAWRDSQPEADPALPIAPEDTAVQLYTSGTTGLPKGVEVTNRNWLAFLADYRAAGLSDLGSGDVVLTCMPVFHVAGTNVGLSAFAFGCTNVVTEDASVPGLLALTARHGVYPSCSFRPSFLPSCSIPTPRVRTSARYAA
jgi:acyl-CoA synthetase (AMP-forming)/AMP-acid ligase II